MPLRAWESCTQKVPTPFCFPRALESPSVVQMPAALDAVGVLLYFVADCNASQGSQWGRAFILWHSLHVVELSALLQAFLEVLVEESYGWQEQLAKAGFLLLSLCLWGRRGLKAVVACFIASSFENCCEQKIMEGSNLILK